MTIAWVCQIVVILQFVFAALEQVEQEETTEQCRTVACHGLTNDAVFTAWIIGPLRHTSASMRTRAMYVVCAEIVVCMGRSLHGQLIACLRLCVGAAIKSALSLVPTAKSTGMSEVQQGACHAPRR